MPLQTAHVIAMAKTNSLRGSTGEVLNPIFVENYTPLDVLEGPSDSQRTWGRAAGKVVESDISGWDKTVSQKGLIHPNDLFRICSMMWGAGTITAEGTAKRIDWTSNGDGDPIPIVGMERYSTAATSYVLYEQAYMNQLGFTFNLNGSLETTVGYYTTKRTAKVATPTIPTPDMTTRLRVSNATAYQTVFSFTPDTGTLADLYADMQTFEFMSPRTVNDTGTTGGTKPNKGVPDPSPLGIETFNFTLKDPGSSLAPDGKYVKWVQGDPTGATWQATWGTPVSGAFTITIIGGATVLDATKKYTLGFSGRGQFIGSQVASGIFTGKLVPEGFESRYLIGDTTTVAQPT